MNDLKFKYPKLSLLSYKDVFSKNYRLSILEKGKNILSDDSDLTKITMQGQIWDYGCYLLGTNPFDVYYSSCGTYFNRNFEVFYNVDIGESQRLIPIRLALKEIPQHIFDEIFKMAQLKESGYEVELGNFYLKKLEDKYMDNESFGDTRECESTINLYGFGKAPICRYNGREYIKIIEGGKLTYKKNQKNDFNTTDSSNEYDIGIIRVIDGGKVAALELVPVVWLIDEKTNTLVSKQSFFAVPDSINLDFLQKYLYQNIFDIMFGNIFEEMHKKVVKEKANVFERIRHSMQDDFQRSVIFSSCYKGYSGQINYGAPLDYMAHVKHINPVQLNTKDQKLDENFEELNNERINELCDYIRSNSLLLIHSKRQIILTKLEELLQKRQSELNDLESDMFVKYGLTIITPEQSNLNLWNGLNDLKENLELALKEPHNLADSSNENITYLRNMLAKYADNFKISGVDCICDLKELIDRIFKINEEYDRLNPTLRWDILELIFLGLNTLTNAIANTNWVENFEYQVNLLKFYELKIVDQLILWFEHWFLDNEDQLSSELKQQYYRIKNKDFENKKFDYVVELSKILDPKLVLANEESKEKKV